MTTVPPSPESAAPGAGCLTSSLTRRIDSVDVMRGLTILAMAFVNDLADFAPVKDVPQWLKHMKAGLNGFTFVDMIIPIFMFILGMSIPLALGKRLAREGGSPVRVLGHVLMRGVSLIIIGLFDANRGAGLGRPYGDMLDWPHGLWKFLAWTFVFIVWLDLPLKSARAKKAHGLIRIAGLAGLIGLAVAVPEPGRRALRDRQVVDLGAARMGLYLRLAHLAHLPQQPVRDPRRLRPVPLPVYRDKRRPVPGCLAGQLDRRVHPGDLLRQCRGGIDHRRHADRAVRPQGEDPRGAGARRLCLHRRLSP